MRVIIKKYNKYVKRSLLIMLSVVLLAGTLTGCRKKDGGNTEPDSSEIIVENYTPKEGDLYIGIFFRYENDVQFGMYAICKGGKIVDCADASSLPEDFIKEDYIGMKYYDAFEKFYNDYEHLFKDEVKKSLDLAVTDDADREKLEEEFAPLAKKLGFSEEIGFVGETKERIIEQVKQFTEDRSRRIAEEKEEEERIRREEEEEEKKRAEMEEKDPSRVRVIGSIEELKEELNKGGELFELENDISLDMGSLDLGGLHFDCKGHNVTLKGVINAKSGDRLLEFENAGGCDLSGITIDEASFEDEKWVRKQCTIMFRKVDYNSLAKPAGIPHRNEIMDLPPFKGCVCYDGREGEDWFSIGYNGPSVSYEEEVQIEKELLTQVLTTGQYPDENDNGGGMMWTKTEVDLGSVDLPNSDYRGFKLMPGASLKITGTIGVTGGRLDWEVSEADQLDITGLTLVKKHPSPDVLKVRFNPSAGINTDLLQCKAGNGKMNISKGSSSCDFSIW